MCLDNHSTDENVFLAVSPKVLRQDRQAYIRLRPLRGTLLAFGSTGQTGARHPMEDAKRMPGQKVGPRSSRASLVKLTDAEHTSIAETARAVGLPVAVMIRRLALGYEPESIVDVETLLELIRLRADLGRLGGVMKMWLVDQPGAGAPEADVRAALNQILDRQIDVAALIGRLDGIVAATPRRRQRRA